MKFGISFQYCERLMQTHEKKSTLFLFKKAATQMCRIQAGFISDKWIKCFDLRKFISF